VRPTRGGGVIPAPAGSRWTDARPAVDQTYVKIAVGRDYADVRRWREITRAHRAQAGSEGGHQAAGIVLVFGNLLGSAASAGRIIVTS